MELSGEQIRRFVSDLVSEDIEEVAAEELARTLENYVGYISEEAVARAREDGRKTVLREDVIGAES